MSTTVNEIMTPMPHTIGHDIPVAKARAMMSEYKCHHLPVLDGGKLVGVISDRDIKMVEQIPKGDEVPVEDLMTDEPFVVAPTQTVAQTVQGMLERNINSAIVSATAESPWGIFTSTNALEYFVKNTN